MPRLTSASHDGLVALLCLETMCALAKISCFEGKPLSSLSVSDNGKSFLNVCEDGSCTLWSFDSKKQTAQLLPPGNVQGKGVYGYWHPSGQILCVGEEGWSLWNGNDATPEIEMLRCSEGGDDASVTSLNFSLPAGNLLAASSGDGTVRVYAMSESAKSSCQLHRSLTMEEIAGNADPNEDSQYQVFNWKCCDGEVLHCAFSPDLKTLVACCDDGVVRLYNWDNPNAPPVTLEGHTDAVTSCSFVRGNSTKLATVSWDGTAKLWDLEEQKCSTSYNGHEGWVRCCALGRFLLTGDDDGYVRVFIIGGEESQKSLKVHEGAINCLCFNSDETNVLTCSDDGTLSVLDLRSYEVVCTMEGHTDAVNDARYTNDGFGVVSVSSDRTLRLWNSRFGHPLVTFGCGTDEVMAVDIAPENEWSVVTSGKDGFIRFWSIDFGSYY